MKTKKTLYNLRDQNPTSPKGAFAINYLHKQFPWLSKADIMKAIELRGPNIDQVLKYLDHKGEKAYHPRVMTTNVDASHDSSVFNE